MTLISPTADITRIKYTDSPSETIICATRSKFLPVNCLSWGNPDWEAQTWPPWINGGHRPFPIENCKTESIFDQSLPLRSQTSFSKVRAWRTSDQRALIAESFPEPEIWIRVPG
ncbi:hypothetical protein NPIL_453771 [Nephila pilipes]|uniref:Uncharacterized protein n=1 Tax=Nephila pilipes TaxID=299642 RepID=A0A8X6TH11_NEPPI|nr:hypothetical protein NPIL_453771 [Nephila pilipes]